jgi:hypothetical protein
MSTQAEISTDRINWYPYERGRTDINKFKYVRTLDYVDKNWSRIQVGIWLKEKRKANNMLVEYSMDDGFSYQPFKLGRADDEARIYTVVQNTKYKVRSIIMTTNETYVAPNPKVSAFLENGLNPSEKKPRVKHDYRWIVMGDGEFTIAKSPPAHYVSKITQEIPMTLAQPNTNKIESGDQWADNNPISRGHVYVLEPCAHLTDNWLNVLASHWKKYKDTIKPEDYVWVESALAYDHDTRDMSNYVFAFAVLSDKYYVDNSGAQYSKIGSRFLIGIDQLPTFLQAINGNGGYAYYNSTGNTIERDSPSEHDLVGAIMSVKAEMQAAIDSRDPERLAQALFDGTQFRDKAVDELKDFTIVLSELRKLTLKIIAEDSDGSPS